jgi:site-specific DNA recombinase
VGIEYNGKRRQTRDPVTGTITNIKQPRAKWLRREVPHLRIVPDELWRKKEGRKRECSDASSHNSGKRSRRTHVYPGTLIRPVSKYCETELYLGRTGKYAGFCCLNGLAGKVDCKLATYKAVRRVEAAILEHVGEHVLTQKFLERVMTEANRVIEVVKLAKSRVLQPQGGISRVR